MRDGAARSGGAHDGGGEGNSSGGRRTRGRRELGTVEEGARFGCPERIGDVIDFEDWVAGFAGGEQQTGENGVDELGRSVVGLGTAT